MLGKILDQSQASHLRKQYAQQSIVFTNGCFDILHAGHVRYLDAAKQLGDVLVIGLNSDESVRELKGKKRPVNPQQDRAEVLAALRMVDHVIIFTDKRVTNLLAALRPDIYTKGGDYTKQTLDQDETAMLKEIGASIQILPLVAGKSTSNLIRMIRDL